MKNKKASFHDYANLAQWDIERYSIICLYWESGSWKSTYIKYFSKYIDLERRYIIIDEVLSVRDFLLLFLKLFSTNKFIIATHVPLIFYTIFSLFWKRVLKINLENFPQKIKKYLTSKWYSVSSETITLYKKYFRLTYTDIDVIIESDDSDDMNFDTIFLRFMKHNRLDVFPYD